MTRRNYEKQYEKRKAAVEYCIGHGKDYKATAAPLGDLAFLHNQSDGFFRRQIVLATGDNLQAGQHPIAAGASAAGHKCAPFPEVPGPIQYRLGKALEHVGGGVGVPLTDAKQEKGGLSRKNYRIGLIFPWIYNKISLNAIGPVWKTSKYGFWALFALAPLNIADQEIVQMV